MHRLDWDAFAAAVLDRRTRLEVERFGRSLLRPTWALEDRTVAEHYLTVIHSGEAEAGAAGIQVRLGPGDAFLVAPGIPHRYRLRGDRLVFFHWRFRLIRARRDLRLDADAVHAAGGEALRAAAAAASACWQRDPRATPWLRAHLVGLLDQIRSRPGRADGLSPGQREAVLAGLAARLPAPVTPRDLARACGLSHDWFARRFRASFGVAPRTWILQERVRHAAEDLLGSADPVGAVGERWGFASGVVFSRQFRGVMGMGPREYRRIWRG